MLRFGGRIGGIDGDRGDEVAALPLALLQLPAQFGNQRGFLGKVRLVPRFEPRELERALRLLGEVPDETVLRLVKLLEGLRDDDVLELVEALSRLSPASARRATKLMSGVVRTVVR